LVVHGSSIIIKFKNDMTIRPPNPEVGLLLTYISESVTDIIKIPMANIHISAFGGHFAISVVYRSLSQSLGDTLDRFFVALKPSWVFFSQAQYECQCD